MLNLKEQVRNYGARETADRVVEMVEAGDLSPEQFSLRRTWDAFIGDVDTTLPLAMKGGLYSGLTEAVHSQAFSVVTQAVLFNKLMAAYTATPTILDKLVSPFPSDVRTEKMTGFTALDGPKDVPEGDEYDETGLSDKAFEGPEPPKRGRAIYITYETVKFDRTGQIMARAAQFGSKMALDREKRGIYAIEDATAGYYCYYPIVAGVPTRTALYRSSAGAAWYNKAVNLITSNALADWTDVQAVMLLFKDMADEAGDLIQVQPNAILVPWDLAATAAQVFTSTELRRGTDTLANVSISANAAIQAFGLMNIDIVPSVFLHETNDWLLGDFKAQFQEQVIIPPQVNEVPGIPRRDIVTGFICRYKSRVYAADDKFVIRSEG